MLVILSDINYIRRIQRVKRAKKHASLDSSHIFESFRMTMGEDTIN